jgi:hypothetical protein
MDKGCHVVIFTDPYGNILDFLNRNPNFFFQIAPQLYSRGLMDPVSDPLLLRKSGSVGNRAWTSGSLAIRPQKRSILHIIILILEPCSYLFGVKQVFLTRKIGEGSI